MKRPLVLLVPVLLLMSLAPGMGQAPGNQAPGNQAEGAGPFTDAASLEQLRERIEEIWGTVGPLLPFLLPVLFIVVLQVLRFFGSAALAAKKAGEARAPPPDAGHREPNPFGKERSEEFPKTRRTRRLERTISDEQGTRGVPIG